MMPRLSEIIVSYEYWVASGVLVDLCEKFGFEQVKTAVAEIEQRLKEHDNELIKARLEYERTFKDGLRRD